jgi:hypothetical protein
MERCMTEHRAHPRHRTLKAGKIVFNHRFSVIDCTVRNLSERGARLEVPSTLGVPNDFDLVIEPDRAARACRVAWKDEHQMGVRFR